MFTASLVRRGFGLGFKAMRKSAFDRNIFWLLIRNNMHFDIGQPQKMVTNHAGETDSNRFKLFGNRPYCSSTKNNKPDNAIIRSSSDSGSSSLSKYDEQYKALKNLDFMTAAKILFTEQPSKKKFGLDFHLVQLFFVCLPSLALYLVAQHARRDMRKMDAELDLKKQAEFEAQAKEMERKAAEEQAAVASNPEILEVKERLQKIEEAVKQIVGESKQKLVDLPTNGNKPQTSKAKPGKNSNDMTKASVNTHGSSDYQDVTKNGGSS